MTEITLCVGDWSNDGHGRTEDIIVDIAGLGASRLRNAYARGAEKTGVDISTICEGYEENFLSPDDIEKLSAFGIIVATRGDDMGDSGAYVSPGEYARLWMLIATVGDPSLDWRILPDNREWVDIGGYGCFSS